jgi:hypothetical protein
LIHFFCLSFINSCSSHFLLVASPRPFDTALPNVRSALSELTSSLDAAAGLIDMIHTSNPPAYSFLSLVLNPSLTTALRIMSGRLSEFTTTSLSAFVSCIDPAAVTAGTQQMGEWKAAAPVNPLEALNVDVHSDGVVTSLKKLFGVALRQGLPFLCKSLNSDQSSLTFE